MALFHFPCSGGDQIQGTYRYSSLHPFDHEWVLQAHVFVLVARRGDLRQFLFARSLSRISNRTKEPSVSRTGLVVADLGRHQLLEDGVWGGSSLPNGSCLSLFDRTWVRFAGVLAFGTHSELLVPSYPTPWLRLSSLGTSG
jgi:hypothetical protein